MRFFRLTPIALAFSLAACGGSGSKQETIPVSASLDEDTTYQYTLGTGGQTPVVVASPSNGVIRITQNGIEYQPKQDFNGTDTSIVEVGNRRYNFTLTIKAVNDLPMLTEQNIKVTAAQEIKGKLDATDADGDTVTFSLVSKPNDIDLTVAEDGSFTFNNSNYVLPDFSFSVSLGDGQDSQTYIVNLSPAFTSNEDKANYYYLSNKSHLNQAFLRLQSIQDDTLISEGMTALSQGFALAALNDRAIRVLEEKIPLQWPKATAYKALSSTYQNMGKTAMASQLRAQSLTNVIQYVADNGAQNLTRDEADFIYNLVKEARQADDQITKLAALSFLDVLTIALQQDEYDRRFGILLQAYREGANTSVNRLLESSVDDPQRQALFEQARLDVEQLAGLSEKAGYRLVSRGELAGERLHSVAPLYLAFSAQLAFSIGDSDGAKKHLANVMSYYQKANYDPAYPVAVKDYATTTLREYLFPLVYAAPYYAMLYPETTDNVFLIAAEQLEPLSFNLARSRDRYMPVANSVKGYLRGRSVDDILNELKADYSDDLYGLLTFLMYRSISTPSFGQSLANLNQLEDTYKVMDFINSHLVSDEYVNQQRNTRTTLGRSGCLKFLKIENRFNRIEQMQQLAAECHDKVLVGHYKQISEDFDSLDYVSAHMLQVTNFFYARSREKVPVTLAGIDQHINAIEKTSTRLSSRLKQALFLIAAGEVEQGLIAFTTAYELVKNDAKMSDNDRADYYLDIIKRLVQYDFSDSSALIFNAENELRRNEYSNSDYATRLQSVRALATQINNELVTLVMGFENSDKVSFSDDLIEALASNREYDRAMQILDQLELVEAEKLPLVAKISVIQALQDDFPGSTVASVDNDGDGKASFFAITASSEAVEQSDIEVDQDSDGDGISDVEDPTPFGE